MLLNLTIIKDFLKDCVILQETLNDKEPRRLKYPVLGSESTILDESHLYLFHSEKMPSRPIFTSHVSIICLGYLPGIYQNDNCESLCLSSDTDLYLLFSQIQEIFSLFSDYESKIKNLLIEGRPVQELKGLAYSLFQTPITVYDKFDRILFMVYDNTRPEFLDLYESYEIGYVPEDERSILYNNPGFLDTFQTKEPAFSSNDIYGTDIIYANLFEQEIYCGRLIIENTYRSFRSSDYSLVKWLADYVLLFMKKNRQFHFNISRELELLMDQILINGLPYRSDCDTVLNMIGWDREDEYVCFATTTFANKNIDEYLNDGAHYLSELFDSQYIYIYHNCIIQIINLSKSEYPYHDILRRLNLFLTNTAYYSGSSSFFQDFAAIRIYVQQALSMAEYALLDRKNRLYEYRQNVLAMMLSKLQDSYGGRTYCIGELQQLMKYDAEKGSSLVKTLKCYINNNLSITRTIEKLYIARSTCLYRFKRIHQLTRLDLEDPSVILYLHILFQIMDWESEYADE